MRRGIMGVIGSILAACVLVASQQTIAGEDVPPAVFFELYGFGSTGSDMETMSNNAVGYGWFARAGVRQDRVGLFIECQRDRWLATDKDVEMKNGVFNMGMGAEYLLLQDRVKMSMSFGTSTLLFDTIFDTAGTTGVYIDFHPTTIRWPITDRMVLALSPFSAIVEIPAVSKPMLKRLEYRTSVGMEFLF